MKPFKKLAATGLVALTSIASTAYADEPNQESSQHHHPLRADSHAPIGVMGDHMHKKGEWMFSYRYMNMSMEGNRNGTNELSPATIATTIPNRFFGLPMQPPTLRVVPTKMTMEMHMFGAMYAPTDDVTLMVMGNYTLKDMDHITFAGPAGTTALGGFTTKTSGFGDTKTSALIRMLEREGHHLHMNLGLSIPTGSLTETDTILTPMGTRPTPRLPYPMQLGTGTFDVLPGITYTGHAGNIGWGAQYGSEVRLGRNGEGYTKGDLHRITGWASYLFHPSVSGSARVSAQTQDSIEGIDPRIVAPVQTANPDFQGGDRVDLGVGLNFLARGGVLDGKRLAAEFMVPVYQDLNGPRLETDWVLTIGVQAAF